MLRSTPLFTGVARSDLDALIRQFEMISAPRGGTIVCQGEPPDHLYVVLSGRVKLERTVGEHRVNMIALMGPGDSIGELAVFEGDPSPISATAIADSALARLPSGALDRWIAIRPHVASRLLQLMARRLRRDEALLAELQVVDTPARVAKQVVELARRFGVRDSRVLLVKHGLTQAELAQLAGTSRETMNRTLAEFANRGWLQTEFKCLVVHDLDRLSHRARLTVR